MDRLLKVVKALYTPSLPTDDTCSLERKLKDISETFRSADLTPM